MLRPRRSLRRASKAGRWRRPRGRLLNDRQKARFQPPPITGVFAYYPGSEKIVEPEHPDTLNHSYNITARVDIPEAGAEGVLFSIGGRFGGSSWTAISSATIISWA